MNTGQYVELQYDMFGLIVSNMLMYSLSLSLSGFC